MGKHEIALNYGVQSADILKEIINGFMELNRRDLIQEKKLNLLVELMGTSLHNIGVQYEYLGNS